MLKSNRCFSICPFYRSRGCPHLGGSVKRGSTVLTACTVCRVTYHMYMYMYMHVYVNVQLQVHVRTSLIQFVASFPGFIVPERDIPGPEPAILDWYGHRTDAVSERSSPARGVWGHAPPGKFGNIDIFRSFLVRSKSVLAVSRVIAALSSSSSTNAVLRRESVL